MRRVLLLLLALATILASPPPAGAQETGTAPDGVTLLDRVVAVVDDDPILASDVEQVIALGLAERREGESREELERRVLDRLIAEKLRFHEIDRFGFAEVSVEEVDRQYAEVRERLGGEEALARALDRVDLDPTGLRQLLARQLMILTYVEERLGPRIFVSLDEIRDYYDEVMVPEAERRGAEPPPIEEVREQIRSLLKERRLNEEIESWTAELRREADVVNYFDEAHSELPPLRGESSGP